VGVGFAAVTSAYRAWVEHQRKEGEGWRRMLESSGVEMVREVKEHEASIDAQRTDLQRILRDFDREKLSRLDEKEEVMFDVVTHHKQRILDEWDEPDDIWTIQAELWAETCTICRIREGVWARHD
jgi:predicted phage gp36 major capsid-like protein